MRTAIIAVLVLVLVLSFALTAFAGQGEPVIERSGNQTGRSWQNGPNGPNYGNSAPTPEPTPTPAPTPESPTSPVTIEFRAYCVYLPYVSNGN